MSQRKLDKVVRANAIKVLTNNGRNRGLVRQINKVMGDKVTLELFNALIASIYGIGGGEVKVG